MLFFPAGAHHSPSHESWLYWGNGGRLPQQCQSQEVSPVSPCMCVFGVTPRFSSGLLFFSQAVLSHDTVLDRGYSLDLTLF